VAILPSFRPWFWPSASPRARLWKTLAIALAVLGCGGILWATAQFAQRTALAQLGDRGDRELRLYIANIQRELGRYRYLPRLLAADPGVRTLLDHPQDRQALGHLNRHLTFVASVSGASAIYVISRDGLTLASSNWNKPDSFVGQNYGFRPYFQEAMRGRLGHYYALGTSSARRGYYFAYPVHDGHRVIGAVTVKVPLESLESGQGNGRDQFLVTDPHGVVFLSTKPAWRYHTLAPLAPTTRDRIIAGRRYADHPLHTLPIVSRRTVGPEAELLTFHGAASSITYLAHGVDMPAAGWRVYILSDSGSVGSYVLHAVLLAGFMLGAALLGVLILLQRRARVAERLRLEHAASLTAAAGEARVRTIIENARAGLVTLDDRGRIEFFNPTAETLFGRNADDVAGRDFTELLTPTAAERFSALLPQTVPGGALLPAVELAARRAPGETLPVEASINAMRLPEGHRAIITLHDISERKRHEIEQQRTHEKLEQRVAERTSDLLATNTRLLREIEEHRHTEHALRQTRDELVQAAKLAAIGQLAAGINHELNQPLTAIRFYADNAAAFLERKRPEDVRDNLGRISGLTERMGRIIQQLKIFARKSSGQRAPVSVTAVIDGVLALLAPRLKREGVAVATELPSQDIYCMGDLVRLEQVFVNLVSNAAQAMQDMPDPRVEIAVGQDGDKVRITVRDHGPGIASEHLAQIFDPFFTTKQSGEGLGLGLSISMHIIEELGGTLRAANCADEGAEFTVELPAAHAPEEERSHAR
jgi:two-component system, NtrC family, C4-dicarboxylate transport sensor histidine kinase DctB